MAEATITDAEIMQELEQIGASLEAVGVVSNRLDTLRYKIVCRERGRHEWYMRSPGEMFCRQCGKTAATNQ